MLLQEAAKRLSHFWYILGRAKRRPKIYQKCILLIYIYIYIYIYYHIIAYGVILYCRLRTNGVSTNGAAAEAMNFAGIGKKVCRGNNSSHSCNFGGATTAIPELPSLLLARVNDVLMCLEFVVFVMYCVVIVQYHVCYVVRYCT